ncbi:MAG: hypothetical protein J5585_11410 [Clostridia bacterium]|nr:hypothetical protein [Clostridia bacterium]
MKIRRTVSAPLAALMLITSVLFASCSGAPAGTDAPATEIQTESEDITIKTETEPVTEPETEPVTEAETEAPADTSSVAYLLGSGAALEYEVKRKLVMSSETVGGVSYRQLQGGCTDGEYMYFAMNDTKSEDSRSIIYKIPLGKKKPTAKSEPLPTDHSNDMTYDSKNGRLVVCHNAPNKKMLSFVDPETLTVTGTHELGFKAYCIQYVPEKEQYVVGVAGTMDVAILDEDFNELRRMSGEKTGYTKQGCDADENYIYFIQYEKNCVVIHDWDYNRIAVIDVPVSGCEPENMFHVGNDFYIGCAAGNLTLYQITLKEAAG